MVRASVVLVSLQPVVGWWSDAGVEMCPTPGGPHPCDCLHRVETGARIDHIKDDEAIGGERVEIHHPNGTVTQLPKCPHDRPGPPAPAPPPGESVITDPCQLGWPHAAPLEAFYQHSKNIETFTANYTVPDSPVDVSQQWLYYWIGLQDLDSAANPVIQPVLSFEGGANLWYFESWNCCPAGHKTAGPQVSIEGPGEQVYGAMEKTDDGLFKITSMNSKGESSVLYSNDTVSGIVTEWNWVELVLETYAVESCSMYSAGGQMDFLNMKLIDTDGQPVVPTWTYPEPYIGSSYLPAQEASEFQACCNGVFKPSWPDSTMEQNSDSISVV